MTESPILDVIFGLAFIFVLLSLIASTLNELIAQVLKTRAKGLERAITRLLGDADIQRKFYAHPLIRSQQSSGARHPSYIPPKAFSRALLAIVSPDDPSAATSAKHLVDKIQDPNMRVLLASFVDSTTESVEKLQKEVEEWFNSSMDRLSGWYKRRTQVVLLIVGAVIAVAGNVDAIHVTKTLWRDPVLRASLASSAEKFIEQETAGSDTTAEVDVKSIYSRLNSQLDSMGNLGLPIGWHLGPGKDENTDEKRGEKSSGEKRTEDRVLRILQKLLGFLITTLAISLGAPFWFDVLGRVASLRGTGKKPVTETPGPTGRSS